MFRSFFENWKSKGFEWGREGLRTVEHLVVVITLALLLFVPCINGKLILTCIKALNTHTHTHTLYTLLPVSHTHVLASPRANQTCCVKRLVSCLDWAAIFGNSLHICSGVSITDLIVSTGGKIQSNGHFMETRSNTVKLHFQKKRSK